MTDDRKRQGMENTDDMQDDQTKGGQATSDYDEDVNATDLGDLDQDTSDEDTTQS